MCSCSIDTNSRRNDCVLQTEAEKDTADKYKDELRQQVSDHDDIQHLF